MIYRINRVICVRATSGARYIVPVTTRFDCGASPENPIREMKINFGSLNAGESRTCGLEIWNIGSEPFILERLLSLSAPFTVEDLGQPHVLPPTLANAPADEAVRRITVGVQVPCDIRQGDFRPIIVNPYIGFQGLCTGIEIPLEATALPPVVKFSIDGPSTLHFTRYHKDVSKKIRIRNNSRCDAVTLTISVRGRGFRVSQRDSTRLTDTICLVAPTDTLEIELWFEGSASSAGSPRRDSEAEIRVSAEEQSGWQSVRLIGHDVHVAPDDD